MAAFRKPSRVLAAAAAPETPQHCGGHDAPDPGSLLPPNFTELDRRPSGGGADVLHGSGSSASLQMSGQAFADTAAPGAAEAHASGLATLRTEMAAARRAIAGGARALGAGSSMPTLTRPLSDFDGELEIVPPLPSESVVIAADASPSKMPEDLFAHAPAVDRPSPRSLPQVNCLLLQPSEPDAAPAGGRHLPPSPPLRGEFLGGEQRRGHGADESEKERRREFAREMREQQREEKRRQREQEITRRSLELEKVYERRIQQKHAEAKQADAKAVEMQAQLEALREQQTERERALREETAEARQAVQRVEAQAKQRTKTCRESRDRAEKALEAARAEVKERTQATGEAAKEEKAEIARARRELQELRRERVRATRSSEDMATRISMSEEAIAVSEQELSELECESARFRSIGQVLEARARQRMVEEVAEEDHQTRLSCSAQPAGAEGGAAAGPTQVALDSLRAELRASEREAEVLDAEETSVLARLTHVEAEVASLRSTFRAPEGTLGSLELFGRETEKLVEERDAARRAMDALNEELERATLAAASRVAEDMASDCVELREAAAVEELAYVCEQLRGACADGRQDLEELAALVLQQQESATQHDRTETRSADSLQAVLPAPGEAMHFMQLHQLQLVCRAELSLCDLRITQAEFWAFKCNEDVRCEELQEKLACLHASGEYADDGASEVALQAFSACASQHEGMLRGGSQHYAAPPFVQELLHQRNELAASLEGLARGLALSPDELAAQSQQLMIDLQAVRVESCRVAASLGEGGTPAQRSSVDSAGYVASAAALQEQREFDAECEEIRSQALHNETISDIVIGQSATQLRVEAELQEEVVIKRAVEARVASEAREVAEEILFLEEEEEERGAAEQHERATLVAEGQVGAATLMHGGLEAFGAVDGQLDTRLREITLKAAAAEQALASEEDAANAAGVELAQLRQRHSEAEMELRAEAAALDAVALDIAAVRATCETARNALRPATNGPGGSTGHLTLQAAGAHECELGATEDSAWLAGQLAAARAEAIGLQEATASEMDAVAQLRRALGRGHAGGGLSAALQAAHAEVLAQQAEEELLVREEVEDAGIRQAEATFHQQDRQASPGSAACGAEAPPAGDGDEAALRHRRRRAEADVADAMAQALKASGGVRPSDAGASTGVTVIPRQLLVAQSLLEARHTEELREVRELARARRVLLEESTQDLQTLMLASEAKLKAELSAWAEERGRLEGRVASGELEHEQLEHNLVREIARLEASARAATAASNDTESDAEATADQAVLAEMNASLRDTYGFLCQQQRQLENAACERDRLQAHLMTTLERISRQTAGLTLDPPPRNLLSAPPTAP